MNNLDRDQLKKEIREEMKYEEKEEKIKVKKEKMEQRKQSFNKFKDSPPDSIVFPLWILGILRAGLIISVLPQAILIYPAFLIVKALFRLIKDM